jgi:hypothetical protein
VGRFFSALKVFIEPKNGANAPGCANHGFSRINKDKKLDP